MGEQTEISWTDHTFNPWIGCTRVSPACDNCYAESLAKRYGWAKWGAGEPRRLASASTWKNPRRWDKAAKAAGVRRRVFCASLADVFDAEVDDEWRNLLMEEILATPNLDWLLLTKRPNVAKKYFDIVPRNVWLGTTVENQAMAEARIPILLSIPARVRFLSCEPLLGPLKLDGPGWGPVPPIAKLDWIIAGGESGPKARPSHPDWFRSLRDQCQAAVVAFHFKQHGEWGLSDPTGTKEAHAIANDGTLYRMADLAYPDGARRGDAIRANHDKAHLHTIYRVGKGKSGAELDGREWREFPT